MAQKNKDGTNDFMIGQVSTTFKMAPDVLVIQGKSTSSWFGLVQKTSYDIIYCPKNINEENVKQLFAYLEFVVFREYAEILEIGYKNY